MKKLVKTFASSIGIPINAGCRKSLVSVSLVLAMLSVAQGQLVNGNFATGDLTGWTVFNDPNGTAGAPTVVLFDTAGTGVSSYSAQFNVGGVFGDLVGYPGAGGGILQYVTLGAGQLTISLDIAASTASFNFDGGTFGLLLDGRVVDSYAFGAIGSFGSSSTVTERSTLSYSGTVTAGVHEIAIYIQRSADADSSTPNQYLNNIALNVTPVPEPSNLLLIGIGLAIPFFSIRRWKTNTTS